LTKANYGEPNETDYRNPNLAGALKSYCFVERFGVGIPIARDRLQKNGNPPPEFTVEDAHVLVTVRRQT
jgi:ATP-dependent DNA helicase RecG